ncbi:MAG: spore cortex-lytic enzyme [Clostridia bacterium BRH_c25]|nr:MAG: spore cortex-lytic enzyme [Clostridia bacterium BRH_c25]
MFNKKFKRLIPFIVIVFIYAGFGGWIYSNYVTSQISYDAGAILLKWGSRGSEVRTVQTKLKNWGFYKGAVDGIYGWRTAIAVKAFQRKHGLKADGIVGNATAKALGMRTGVATAARKSTSRSNETYTLAQCIHGEARGESYIGQVAVAAVILNRVDDSRFPNTIAGVIFQPGAFTAVSDGQMFQPPGDTALKAARDALNGWDPSGGAIYYYNPAKTTNKWIWSRPIIKVIGKHYFCK